VTKIMGSGSDDWIYYHFGYTLSLLITINTALSLYLHNFQFTVAHALGFSVLTSRFLAKDLNTGTVKVSLNYTLSLLATLLIPWNFGTQVKSIYYSLLQLTTAL
jgi:hypothetical protein